MARWRHLSDGLFLSRGKTRPRRDFVEEHRGLLNLKFRFSADKILFYYMKIGRFWRASRWLQSNLLEESIGALLHVIGAGDDFEGGRIVWRTRATADVADDGAQLFE